MGHREGTDRGQRPRPGHHDWTPVRYLPPTAHNERVDWRIPEDDPFPRSPAAQRSGGAPLEWRCASTLPAPSLEVWANPAPRISGQQRGPPSIEERGKVAADLLRSEGYVILRDALPPEAVRSIKGEADALGRRIMAADPEGLGNRGEARWSCAGSVRGSDATNAVPSLLPMLGRAEGLEHMFRELEHPTTTTSVRRWAASPHLSDPLPKHRSTRSPRPLP